MNSVVMCSMLKLAFVALLSHYRMISVQALLPSQRLSVRSLRPLQFSPVDVADQLPHLQLAAEAVTSQLSHLSHTSSLPVSDLALTTGEDLGAIGESTDGGALLAVLGNDLLIFLCATIGIVPLFKALNASPVIGFLSAGLLMGPAGLGLFSDLSDMESLADAGVLFLLFEQGLELTVERLKNLRKYAFGMGTLQVLLCTAAFFTFPFLGGITFLENFIGSPAEVVEYTRFDEALVIGAALSLSSSAFVLKIMQERGQLATKSGSAALGILLLQDIAVVPLLVLLPIIENSQGSMPMSEQAALLGVTFLKAILGLGGILVVGGQVTKFLFALIATTRSSETFVALVLLVALGTGALTDYIGLSSTLGAFTAGTLLAESNYRTQIESDIKPFRGLLLGLFFLTTGASVDPVVIREQWTTVLALLTGLLAFKAVITTSLGPLFGLSKSESVKTGLLLSGGGEFAFVVLTLADRLNVIPDKLAKVLVGVVVLSMALTPTLSTLGDKIADYFEAQEKESMINELSDGNVSVEGGKFSVPGQDASVVSTPTELDSKSSALADDVLIKYDDEGETSFADGIAGSEIVICGFNRVGQTVASFIQDSEINGRARGNRSKDIMRYVGFDLDPKVVIENFREGKRVLYGDGSLSMVLETAGVTAPKLFIITYENREMVVQSVERLRQSYPTTPIYARAADSEQINMILEAGATQVFSDEIEASLRMAYNVLDRFDLPLTSDPNVPKDVSKLIKKGREDLEMEQKVNYDAYQAEKYLNNNPDPNRAILRDGSPFKRFETIIEDQAKKASNFAADMNTLMDSSIDAKSSRQEPKPRFTPLTSQQQQNVDVSKGGKELELVEGVDICTIPSKNSVVGEEVEEKEKQATEPTSSSELVEGVDICTIPERPNKKNQEE